MKKIPRKFIFLFIILAIIIISIPIYYITVYFNTKIDVVDKLGVTENVREIKNELLADYDLEVECSSFDITDKYSASYKVTISEQRLPGTLVDNAFSVKLALASNWINADAFKSSTSHTISMKYSDTHSQSYTITGLEVFSDQTIFLVPFQKPTLYVLVSYSLLQSGVTTKYNDIISYPYGDYKVLTGGYDAN